ncbi:hypothetical protein OPV22_033406 [Ensete ventricosum]|uniref:Uncharacterized protein n=1 Tax=Ensete ventricosum TaxID=4639 RepID=A0AAV8P285_ENSVE|nr:hypothetical protein OPV22_033406 [Ensete ventricosum]
MICDAVKGGGRGSTGSLKDVGMGASAKAMLALPASDDVWWPGGAGAGSCRFLPSLWFLAAPSSPFLLLSCSLITHTAKQSNQSSYKSSHPKKAWEMVLLF